jgi:glycerol kinase
MQPIHCGIHVIPSIGSRCLHEEERIIMAEAVAAIDQGTTSTRCVIFDVDGTELGSAQLEHGQFFEQPGYVEHDPMEIWRCTLEVLAQALRSARLHLGDVQGLGIANQRETTVVWERDSGRPIAPAIVWQDTRSRAIVERLIAEGCSDLLHARTGLPLSTYSSATKLAWLLEHVDGARARAKAGELCFGTIDSWLIWKATGKHVTDVTNASRTMLLDLETLEWSDELLDLFEVPRQMLPTVVSSSLAPGELLCTGIDGGEHLSVTGILGDQQAALVGQRCFEVGDIKNTYGTGSFLLVNTGTSPIRSTRGLLSTVAYRLGEESARFALEGAIAVTGSAVQWLRDQLGIIATAAESEVLASSVPDSSGVYFVPAFSGLFAPYWRADASGTITGLTRTHTRAHLARATLEAAGFQTYDVVRAVEQDLGAPIDELRADGGMAANDLCLQLQADILGKAVVRVGYPETTVLGAAYAAGVGAELWNQDDLPRPARRPERRFTPQWSTAERERRLEGWHRAVARTFDRP